LLRSRYNRFAARLNAARLRPYGHEEGELLAQLQYLKEQITQYPWAARTITGVDNTFQFFRLEYTGEIGL
jgi:hypothetical protein